jgi:hypothetical protein
VYVRVYGMYLRFLLLGSNISFLNMTVSLTRGLNCLFNSLGILD